MCENGVQACDEPTQPDRGFTTASRFYKSRGAHPRLKPRQATCFYS